MNYFECHRVENCFSRTAVYQYRIPGHIDDLLLAIFEKHGTVKCQRNLPRPYFNIILPEGVAVKGVMGDIALKVVFPFDNTEEYKVVFEQLLTRLIEEWLAGEGKTI